jgi:transposase
MAAPRLREAERRQVSLRPVGLEDLLPADHRARLVWAFAERLDLSALYGAIEAVEGRPGHPPADPRVLLALRLHAAVEGVGSARALDRLRRGRIGFGWRCGGAGVDHAALAEFRVAHGAVLERLLADGFAAVLKTGHASLDRAAQDGMRVRAAAGAASFRRRASLERRRAEAAAEVARLRAELEADPGVASRRQADGRPPPASARRRTAGVASKRRWPWPGNSRRRDGAPRARASRTRQGRRAGLSARAPPSRRPSRGSRPRMPRRG